MHRGFDRPPHPDTGETAEEAQNFEQVARGAGAVAVMGTSVTHHEDSNTLTNEMPQTD